MMIVSGSSLPTITTYKVLLIQRKCHFSVNPLKKTYKYVKKTQLLIVDLLLIYFGVV